MSITSWKDLYELPAGTVVRCLEDDGLGIIKQYADTGKWAKVVQWDDGCVTSIRPSRAGTPSIVINGAPESREGQNKLDGDPIA